MSVIYDEQIGAQHVRLFGCSLKSINMQMGFDDQSTVVTIVVVEENDQTFILDPDDIQSIQHIQFGELDILGIVQAWENVTTDAAGTGIYTVKMTDCRMILDNAIIITNPAINWQTNNFGINQLASGEKNTVVDYGENIITIPLPTEHDFSFGLPFASVKESLDQAILHYGKDTFELNVDALEALPYDSVGTGMPGGMVVVRIDGPVKSISEVITEICQQFGYQWWIECCRKSSTDKTIIIKVKIVSRVNETDNPITLSLDALAELHSDQIIFRKDGHENTNELTKTILQGGVRRQLFPLSSDLIRPFWGWNESGTVPLNRPAYQDPQYNTYRLKHTSRLEMGKALNGELDNIMDEVDLAALKGYANSHWGKTFYLQLDPSGQIDSDGVSWVKSVPAGWWEHDDTPDGLDSIALFILSSDDGRWKPFLKFPRMFYRWDDSVLASNNAVSHNGRLYVLCSLKQTDPYVIMDLSVPAKFVTSAPNQSKKINCSTNIDGGWIPFLDSRKFYGPWSSDTQTPSRFRKRGKTTVQIDSDLVPWKHGFRGISNEQGMRELNWIAEGRIKAGVMEQQIINTGQLEVADIPKVNIGQIIAGGSNITNISTQFGIDRITTRYSMNLYTSELGNFRQIERKKINEFFRLLRATLAKTAYKQDASTNEEIKTLFDKYSGPTDIKTRYSYEVDKEDNDRPYTEETPSSLTLLMTITGAYLEGPYYDVSGGGWAFSKIPNLSESWEGPGYLVIGRQVLVNVLWQEDTKRYAPYIEQTPPTFAPPTS